MKLTWPFGKIIRNEDLQSRFLSRSMLLAEQGANSITRLLVLLSLLVVMLFIWWASILNIDEVATVPGVIQPYGELIKVEHPVGGKISKVYVKDGQHVNKGEPLIALEKESVQRQLDEITINVKQLAVSKERLSALLENRKPDFSKFDSSYAEEVRNGRRYYEEMLQREESGRMMLVHQLSQISSQLRSIKEEKISLQKNVDLLKQEINLRKPLVEEGLNSRVSFLALERTYNEARSQVELFPEKEQQLLERKQEKEAELREYTSAVREKYSAEYLVVKSELQTIERSQSFYSSNVDSLTIVASSSGYVHGMHVRYAGEVIQPGEPILEIVPDGREMEARVEIDALSIGHITEGQRALVKFTTYDYNRYGGIRGVVRDISVSSFLRKDGSSYYNAVVELEKQTLGKKTVQERISPGMTVSTEIQTGSKTLMEYLLKPVFNSVNQSFREK